MSCAATPDDDGVGAPVVTACEEPGDQLFTMRRDDQRSSLGILPSPLDAVTKSRRPSFRCSDDEDPEHSTDDTLPFPIELPLPETTD